MRTCLLFWGCCGVAFAGSVEGTVTNAATGEAVKRATVTLMSRSRAARYIVSADDAGRFTFPDVEAAPDWVAEARAQGFALPKETRQALKERPPIAVAEREPVKGVTVKLAPLGAIEGRVVDGDAEAVRGVTVQALQYQYRGSGRRLDIRASAVTDARGRYRLYFLEPGRYVLRAYLHETPPGPAEPSPHVHNFVPEDGFPPSYYPGTPEAEGASAVEVKAGAELSGYDFRMERTAAYHVRGTLAGADDPRTRVVVAPCSTRAMDFGFTFSADMLRDGRFDARGITPGRYCVAVHRLSGGRLATANAQVTVTDHDVNGMALEAPLTPTIQGAVQMDPSGAERPHPITVQVSDLDTPGLGLGYAMVQGDGTFLMRFVPSGPASLSVNGHLEESYLKSFRFAGEASRGAFEVPRTGGNLTLVMGTDGGQVHGKVQDQDGNPGDHMLVTIAPAGTLAQRMDLIRTVSTSDDGSFEVKGLAPGDYQAFAWEGLDDYATRSPEFLKLFADRASAVTVMAGAPSSVQVKSVRAQEMEEAIWKGQQ
jgi:hypothetical protein